MPYLTNGLLDYGAQQTFNTTTANTARQNTAYTIALQQQIPPLTLQEVNATAKADTITVRVPVTVKTYYTCNKVTPKACSHTPTILLLKAHMHFMPTLCALPTIVARLQVETKQTVALIKTDGTLSATAAQLSIVYGAQYPLG